MGNFFWFLSRLVSRAAEGHVRRVQAMAVLHPFLIDNPFDKIRKLTKKVRKIRCLSIP